MTNCSNYKIHMPVVKLSQEQKATSVSPYRMFLLKEKYYQNNIDHECEKENYTLYNSYITDGKS